MPIFFDLAARGLPICVLPPVDVDFAGHAAQNAEQCKQQFALALAVQAAEADNLARADRE